MTDRAADPARHRRAVWARVAFVAASIACAVIVVQIARRGSEPLATTIPRPPDDLSQTYRLRPPGPAEVLRMRVAEPDSLLTAPGAEPLREPPAGLPVYQGARLLYGQQRREPRWLEQQATYAADGADPDAIADFYEAAAARAGFALKPAAGATPMDRIFVGPAGVLHLRLNPVDDQVRITLILRSTVEPTEPHP